MGNFLFFLFFLFLIRMNTDKLNRNIQERQIGLRALDGVREHTHTRNVLYYDGP